MSTIVIGGTNSNAGKTTVTMGLLAALSKKMKVQSFKVGPDYIDPAYHTFITKRKCRNLDGWMLGTDAIRYLYEKNSKDADINVIEGVMGLYDGADIKTDLGSTAFVSKTLNAPVILVVDGSGISKSIAAEVLGYSLFDKDTNIAGVILNRLSGDSHYQLLKEAIETYTGIPCCGYLNKNLNVSLPSRHLGLVQQSEITNLKEKIEILASEVEKTLNLDKILKIANSTKAITKQKEQFNITPLNKKVKIAVAYDEAFSFYYSDNIDLLRELGAEIEFFSPLKDEKLPLDCNGLILGGGYPEVFAEQLSKNTSMKKDIYEKLENGMPYYAECGGLMYLTDTLSTLDNKTYKMVGWFNGHSQMTKRLQHFGYAELSIINENILGQEGEKIRIHEFHHSYTEISDAQTAFNLAKYKNNKKVKEWNCGYIKGNGVAGYPHLHFYSNIDFAKNLVKNFSRSEQQ